MPEKKNEASKIPDLVIKEFNDFTEGRIQLSREKLETYIKQYPHILVFHEDKVDLTMSSSINTFLLNAIANNQTHVAELLIDLDVSGNSLDIQDNYATGRNSPLLLALKKGNIAIAKKLINRDVNLHCEDHFGYTPIIWAAILRADEVMAMLINKGVNPHEKLDLIKAGDIYNMLHAHKTPRRAIKTSAYQVYVDEIKPEDVEYPGSERAADSIYFTGTHNPLYSDLHWHAKDVLINYFHISSEQIDIWKNTTLHQSTPIEKAFSKSLPEKLASSQLKWLSAPRKIVSYQLEQDSHPPQLLEGFFPEFGLVAESAKIEFAQLRSFIRPNMKLFDKDEKMDLSEFEVNSKKNMEQAINEYQKLTKMGREDFESKLYEEIEKKGSKEPKRKKP